MESTRADRLQNELEHMTVHNRELVRLNAQLKVSYQVGIICVLKVAVHQFNEIHTFASSFIFYTMVFCTGVLQYAFCFVYR